MGNCSAALANPVVFVEETTSLPSFPPVEYKSPTLPALILEEDTLIDDYESVLSAHSHSQSHSYSQTRSHSQSHSTSYGKESSSDITMDTELGNEESGSLVLDEEESNPPSSEDCEDRPPLRHSEDPVAALLAELSSVDMQLEHFVEDDEDEEFFVTEQNQLEQGNGNSAVFPPPPPLVEMYTTNVEMITHLDAKCCLLRQKAELLQVVGQFEKSIEVLLEEIRASSSALKLSTHVDFERSYAKLQNEMEGENDNDKIENDKNDDNHNDYNNIDLDSYNNNTHSPTFTPTTTTTTTPSVTFSANMSADNNGDNFDIRNISMDDLQTDNYRGGALGEEGIPYKSGNNGYTVKLNLRVSEAHHNLGTIYRGLGELDKSEEFCKLAIRGKLVELGERDERVGDSLGSYSLTLQMNGKEEESQEMSRRAMRIFHNRKEIDQINSWWWHNGGS